MKLQYKKKKGQELQSTKKPLIFIDYSLRQAGIRKESNPSVFTANLKRQLFDRIS